MPTHEQLQEEFEDAILFLPDLLLHRAPISPESFGSLCVVFAFPAQVQSSSRKKASRKQKDAVYATATTEDEEMDENIEILSSPKIIESFEDVFSEKIQEFYPELTPHEQNVELIEDPQDEINFSPLISLEDSYISEREETNSKRPARGAKLAAQNAINQIYNVYGPIRKINQKFESESEDIVTTSSDMEEMELFECSPIQINEQMNSNVQNSPPKKRIKTKIFIEPDTYEICNQSTSPLEDCKKMLKAFKFPTQNENFQESPVREGDLIHRMRVYQKNTKSNYSGTLDHFVQPKERVKSASKMVSRFIYPKSKYSNTQKFRFVRVASRTIRKNAQFVEPKSRYSFLLGKPRLKINTLGRSATKTLQRLKSTSSLELPATCNEPQKVIKPLTIDSINWLKSSKIHHYPEIVFERARRHRKSVPSRAKVPANIQEFFEPLKTNFKTESFFSMLNKSSIIRDPLQSIRVLSKSRSCFLVTTRLLSNNLQTLSHDIFVCGRFFPCGWCPGESLELEFLESCINSFLSSNDHDAVVGEFILLNIQNNFFWKEFLINQIQKLSSLTSILDRAKCCSWLNLWLFFSDDLVLNSIIDATKEIVNFISFPNIEDELCDYYQTLVLLAIFYLKGKISVFEISLAASSSFAAWSHLMYVECILQNQFVKSCNLIVDFRIPESWDITIRLIKKFNTGAYSESVLNIRTLIEYFSWPASSEICLAIRDAYFLNEAKLNFKELMNVNSQDTTAVSRFLWIFDKIQFNSDDDRSRFFYRLVPTALNNLSRHALERLIAISIKCRIKFNTLFPKIITNNSFYDLLHDLSVNFREYLDPQAHLLIESCIKSALEQVLVSTNHVIKLLSISINLASIPSSKTSKTILSRENELVLLLNSQYPIKVRLSVTKLFILALNAFVKPENQNIAENNDLFDRIALLLVIYSDLGSDEELKTSKLPFLVENIIFSRNFFLPSNFDIRDQSSTEEDFLVQSLLMVSYAFVLAYILGMQPNYNFLLDKYLSLHSINKKVPDHQQQFCAIMIAKNCLSLGMKISSKNLVQLFGLVLFTPFERKIDYEFLIELFSHNQCCCFFRLATPLEIHLNSKSAICKFVLKRIQKHIENSCIDFSTLTEFFAETAEDFKILCEVYVKLANDKPDLKFGLIISVYIILLLLNIRAEKHCVTLPHSFVQAYNLISHLEYDPCTFQSIIKILKDESNEYDTFCKSRFDACFEVYNIENFAELLFHASLSTRLHFILKIDPAPKTKQDFVQNLKLIRVFVACFQKIDCFALQELAHVYSSLENLLFIFVNPEYFLCFEMICEILVLVSTLLYKTTPQIYFDIHNQFISLAKIIFNFTCSILKQLIGLEFSSELLCDSPCLYNTIDFSLDSDEMCADSTSKLYNQTIEAIFLFWKACENTDASLRLICSQVRPILLALLQEKYPALLYSWNQVFRPDK